MSDIQIVFKMCVVLINNYCVMETCERNQHYCQIYLNIFSCERINTSNDIYNFICSEGFQWSKSLCFQESSCSSVLSQKMKTTLQRRQTGQSAIAKAFGKPRGHNRSDMNLSASSSIRLHTPLPACSVCVSSFIALISEIKCFSCISPWLPHLTRKTIKSTMSANCYWKTSDTVCFKVNFVQATEHYCICHQLGRHLSAEQDWYWTYLFTA